MSEKLVKVYHTIMENDNFEIAAKDLLKLVINTQKQNSNKLRVLYVNIKGHRNKAGGFDQDMYKLQMEYGREFLIQFFKEIHFPLYSMKNVSYQNNDIPKKLKLYRTTEEDMSIERLYIENYSNTEFISERDVYCYLEHFSVFLRCYNEWEWRDALVKTGKFDEKVLMNLWYQHLKDIINEIFNNFIYGNLLSATAMTRTLIECYVYISILIKEKDPKLIEDWYLCSLIRKARNNNTLRKAVLKYVRGYCKIHGINYSEVKRKFYGENGNDNNWLLSIVESNKYGSVTFYGACKYLGETYIYGDYQNLCSFVHGQDVYSKMMPFTFYSSIYTKLYLMSEYIFKAVSMFEINTIMENQIQNLKDELYELGEHYLC